MDFTGKTVSNILKNKFPNHYREHGPLLVEFITKYFEWLENQSYTRDEYITPKFSWVKVVTNSANVIGTGTTFTENFANGDSIAIARDVEIDDFEIFTIKEVSNNTFLTLQNDYLPNFDQANTPHAKVVLKPNANWLTRNYFDIKDIDDTLDEYIIYFKEKYLKSLQFKTVADTRRLVKHSLDLYRSKGTERSIDLLYKAVFGKPASIYYPKIDLFRLSAGDWFIPKYLELSLSENKVPLIKKQVVGTLSGATAFIDEVVRRSTGDRIMDIAYVSAINGYFQTGERITTADRTLTTDEMPKVVGSLNELVLSAEGVGSGYSNGDVLSVSSNGGGIQGLARVTGTSNTVGEIQLSLLYGGYGYANTIQVQNTTGNVEVNTTSSDVIGTGTDFANQYSSNDYISVWSNSSSYETLQIASVTNSTVLTVNGNFTFDNTETKAAFTRYFAQTFISDQIVHVTNVTVSNSQTNFEYFNFLEPLTQPMAILNYENANGQFANGDSIYAYHANNDLKGEGLVLTFGLETTYSGVLTVAIVEGDLNDNAIYSTANAVGANLNIANGYTDITASANVIGTHTNVVVSCVNVSGNFTVGQKVIQFDGMAEGYISAITSANGTNATIEVSNSFGIFKQGHLLAEEAYPVTEGDTIATGYVSELELDVGVINVNNSFLVYANNFANSSFVNCRVNTTSQGTGAGIVFANNLQYTENIEYNTDLLSEFLDYRLAIPLDVLANSSEPNTFILNSGNTDDLLVGFAIANSSNLASVNTDVFSNVDSIINSTAFTTTADICVGDDASVDLIARVDWPFDSRANTDLETIIDDSLGMSNMDIGAIVSILSYNPGTDYNQTPIVRLHEPTLFRYDVPDTVLLKVTDTTGFEGGELITQTNTDARGILTNIVNTTAIEVLNMRFYNDNQFIVTVDNDTRIMGSDSGFYANITLIDIRDGSRRYGSDVEFDASVAVGAGAITNAVIVDSGFGFTNGESVTLSLGSNTAEGWAVVSTQGTGSGYYRDRNGFLSNTKKLTDGYYYQEYSYEVQSSVSNKLKEVLKDVIHVAGLGYFEKFVYDSINSSNTNSNSSLTIKTETELRLRDDTSYLWLSGDEHVPELMLRDGISFLTFRNDTDMLTFTHLGEDILTLGHAREDE
jgi:hypothetical protein